MKTVAANHADCLRRPGSANTAEDDAVFDAMRQELRNLYGAADDHVPIELAALAERLDRADPSYGLSA